MAIISTITKDGITTEHVSLVPQYAELSEEEKNLILSRFEPVTHRP